MWTVDNLSNVCVATEFPLEEQSAAPEVEAEATCLYTPWDGPSSSSSSSTLVLLALLVYLTLAMLTNLIGLYKVVVVWNMIIEQQRIPVDWPEFCRRRRRRMSYKDSLKLQLVSDSRHHHLNNHPQPHHDTCVICLSEFTANEIVTACDGGCRQWFHKDCLFEWLDRSEHCPCCRRDMLMGRRGFFADLSACMGFRAR